MNWKQFVEKLFSLAEPYLVARGDRLHTLIAHQYALFLLQQEGGDKRVVEPAIILHDVGWSKLEPGDIKIAFGVRAAGEEAARLNRIHELEGASIARELLEELAYDPLLVDQITSIILRHDSGCQPESLEEKLVKDADKLWRFSKIGFWNELTRQKLTTDERYRFLHKHHKTWFFTKTASAVAKEELKKRALEIEWDQA
jgi:HD superfamily phosphodiesterase